jgi:ribosomal protein RSM22 (predicted rRNA methylase)
MSEADMSRVKVDVPPIQYNKNQTMAYVAHRIPGIYSCNFRVLDEIKRRLPGFAPKRMLDFGSGPGTTTWAASQVFSSIKRYLLVEPSDAMVAVSSKILEDFPVERRRFLHQGTAAPVDIVVASYSLSELATDTARRAHVRSMWELLNPGGVLVLIEAGTPIGFKVVRGARSSILELRTGNNELDPNVIAPCPHNNACGQPSESWCHFIQRVERTDILRSSKKASMNWENEKFSYVAIVKGPRPAFPLPVESPNVGLQESRLVRQPIKRGGHVIMDACMPSGSIIRRTVARSDGRDLYKSARKSAWGDAFFFDRLPQKKDPKEKKRFWWSPEVRGKRRGTFMKEQNKKQRMDDAVKQLNELRDEMASVIGRLPDTAPQKNMRMDQKQGSRTSEPKKSSAAGGGAANKL